MYLTIREYQTHPDAVEEIMRTDAEGFVPLIHQAAGFQEYFCIDAGNGTIASVSLFENRTDGETFNQVALDWVQQNLGTLLPGAPQTTSGEVLVHATGKVPVS